MAERKRVAQVGRMQTLTVRRNPLRVGRADQLELQSELTAVAQDAVPTLLTVTSPLRITASSLRGEIAPVLEALEEIQKTADVASGIDYRGQVTAISQSSPVKISLEGLHGAVKLVLELVIPWRREHAREMLRLKEEEAELENQNRRTQISRERAQIAGLVLENRQRETQLAQDRMRLKQARVELAQHALKTLDRNGGRLKSRKDVYLQKLIRAIEALTESDIEFEASGPE